MKTLTCREHGGTFKIPAGRGRPPTRCGGKWEACSRAEQDPPLTSAQTNVVKAFGNLAHAVAQIEPTPTPVNPALAAKSHLEAQGFLCTGRGFRTDPGESYSWGSMDGTHTVSGMALPVVELTAVRDSEMILMVWLDGELVQQHYSLWHDKPSANGKPTGSLNFNPDECTDKELVHHLAGSKVTWWNVLGQREETAVVSPHQLKIEHMYNNVGDETAGDRILKFTDHTGVGSRAFRIGALLKVG